MPCGARTSAIDCPKAFMPALDARVRRAVRLAAEGAAARHVDHRPAAGGPQVGDRAEHRVGRAGQVGGEGPRPERLPVVVRRGQRRVGEEDPGVVDQHVEPAQPLGGGVDGVLTSSGRVMSAWTVTWPSPGRRGADLLGPVGRRAVVHPDPVALGGEGAGDGGADAAGAAGDEDSTAAEDEECRSWRHRRQVPPGPRLGLLELRGQPQQQASAPSRPTNWTPSGSPAAVQCSGTLIAGRPVRLASWV